nr:uncharacterized protein LOC113704790 [Coffea arabica]
MELLQRRKENRAAKKKNAYLLPRIRKVPLGYMESGVSFPDSHHEKLDGANHSSMYSEKLGSEALKRGHGSADVITEALQYMSSRDFALFVPHVHSAPSSETANDMPNASIFAELPLTARADLRSCKGKFLPKKRKNLNLPSSTIEPDFCLPRRKIRNSILVALHDRLGDCFNRFDSVVQALNFDKEYLLTNNLFENPVEYCSSAHVFVNSEELYPLTTTSKTGQFPQQKDASFNEQNSIIGFACSFRVMSVDRPNSSSRLSESILQPSCIGKDPLLAPELFENVAIAPKRGRQRRIFPINEIPHEALTLPDAADYEHCGAKRFHLEPPNFCCSGGDISIVAPSMFYDLKRLFIENNEESAHFKNNVWTYNNNWRFTSFAAKYDPELTKNTKGVYTFRVQGQVYHFLNSLMQSYEKPSEIQFYFFDSEEELAKRIGSSDKLRESTLRLLMCILSNNPYAKFFKNLRHVPNIDTYKIVLNCHPGLDQRYPILFPQGECGWHHGVKKCCKRKRKADSCEDDLNIDPFSVNNPSYLLDLEHRAVEHGKNEEDTVSVRKCYCYRFQIRDSDESMLLHCLRLLQQFLIDSYVKIEISKLDFHRHLQNVVRSEILQGVLDSVSLGKTEGSKVGRRIVLPASFIGGSRDMRHRYLDAMALVQKYEKSDIFLTMTYNPAWKEIQCNLKYHEKPQDRPDFLARVLRAKFEMLKHELLNRQIFGEVAACVYVIEFQKRGFSHAHLLLILKPQFKLLNPESYDKIVCAELPDRLQYPHLYSLVVKHMIHGSCGDMNKSCPCMKDGSCKNHYPKIFCPHTTHGEDSYPYYRRRDGGKKVKVRRFTLDNRIMTDDSATDTDEIKEFQKGRYISPPEAFWRIYEFRLNEMTPSIYTLQIHLPNQQLVSFPKNSDLLQLLAKVDFFKTMLIEFFKMNTTNATAENLKCFYKDFPQHFVWSSKYKHWTERKRRKVIGRLVSVNPREGERYYLRLLLNHIPGPISFEDLLTVHDKKMNSFREAALALGLLQSDTYIEETLEEAAAFQMPSSLRLLFATLLVYCSPTGPTMGLVLADINKSLKQMGTSIAAYQLPLDDLVSVDQVHLTKKIEAERNIDIPPENLLMSLKLNSQQKYAYNKILKACFASQRHSFFIDGPGGTGKTFLYRSLLATLKSQGYIAIAVATSGIAASILPGGRTAHSRFKIPLDFSKNRTCQLSKQGSVAKLFSESKLILWDEASMAKRETIEAFDDLLRDIMESELPFGGKVIVFGGDFRQTLPVIEQATKEVLLQSCFLNSPL